MVHNDLHMMVHKFSSLYRIIIIIHGNLLIQMYIYIHIIYNSNDNKIHGNLLYEDGQPLKMEQSIHDIYIYIYM